VFEKIRQQDGRVVGREQPERFLQRKDQQGWVKQGKANYGKNLPKPKKDSAKLRKSLLSLVRPARFELAAYGFVVGFRSEINRLETVAMVRIR